MTLQASRRAFLRRAGALSLAGAATPWAVTLSAMGDAAAATASDYKALVCVFLYGGNDYANTVVPYDATSYAQYQALRPRLAYAQSALATTVLSPTVALPGARQYALAPELAPLLPIFDAGRLGVLLNIGTLIQPTTKAQYTARSVPLPPKLFSHNDQQSFWQSSSAEGATTGWGGRIGDLAMSSNGNATFTCVNVSGNAVFVAGDAAVQYQITSNGSVALNALKTPMFGSQACSNALRALVTAPRTHLMEAQHTAVMARAIDANDQLVAALAGGTPIATAFPAGNTLAAQLKMVARMIASSSALGAKRQVFFVSLGGFDNHDGLTSIHPGLLTTVADAMAAFHAATVELGVAAQVTSFTASDFGRTLVGNNDGSDHGWGSMHLVMGGAVRGRAFYGTAPVVANNGPDDVGQGRLLPRLAVDQLAATLGRWFGLSPTDLATVLPHLANFDPSARDLGFV
jgi:uncharacterized protein (DUF1501 family)